MCFSLMLSNSLIPKNLVNPNKYVNKNLKSRIVEFLPPYFINKVFIISEVMDSFLAVSVSHNRWHHSKAEKTEQKDFQ